MLIMVGWLSILIIDWNIYGGDYAKWGEKSLKTVPILGLLHHNTR